MLKSLLIAASLAVPSLAAAQQTIHVRGTVAEVDGQTVTMQTTQGETRTVEMAPDYTLFVYTGIEVADLGRGDFLSIPSVAGPDGGKEAVSINVFPDAMAGSGEGETSWDLTEGSRMTNATVGKVESAPEGNTITVTYNDVEEEVQVPEGTPITRFAPDPERRLKAGDKAVIFAQPEGDTLKGSLAGVSADGSLPPV